MPREDSRKEIPQTIDSIDQERRVDDATDFERPISRKVEQMMGKILQRNI